MSQMVWVDGLMVVAWDEGRRRRFLFLLLLYSHARNNTPHPAFAVFLNLSKGLTLPQIMAYATLPPLSSSPEPEIRIFPHNGTVYRWQRHLTL